jgi:hypothetical protein
MNRMARRMIRFRKRFSARRSQGTMSKTEPDLNAVRAKSRTWP